jgi:hypothetical protein
MRGRPFILLGCGHLEENKAPLREHPCIPNFVAKHNREATSIFREDAAQLKLGKTARQLSRPRLCESS